MSLIRLNKNLIRLILPAIVFLCVLFSLPSKPAGAIDLNSKHDLCTGANLAIQQQGAGCGKVYDPSKDKYVDEKDADKADNKVTNLIKAVLNVISVIVGIAAVIMVIYGGFRFVTSAGNPEATKAGRNAILYALGGLVIVAFAQIIVKFVLKQLE